MRLITILRGQARSLFRDPMSLFLSFIPFILLGIVKYGLPVLTEYLKPWVDLTIHREFILLILYLMTPTMLGIVLGLLLMDERDMDVLSYIDVTPFKLSNYILIKSVLGSVFSFVVNLILALFVSVKITDSLIFTFILASLLVPFYAFLIFAFSKNKIGGLTIGKLGTFIIIGAIIPYYTSSPLIYITGLLPTFWIYKCFFDSIFMFKVLFFIIGLVETLTLIVLLRIKSKISI